MFITLLRKTQGSKTCVFTIINVKPIVSGTVPIELKLLSALNEKSQIYYIYKQSKS
jgi:hypothetical protein